MTAQDFAQAISARRLLTGSEPATVRSHRAIVLHAGNASILAYRVGHGQINFIAKISILGSLQLRRALYSARRNPRTSRFHMVLHMV
jgi:hypothetical protein